MTIGLSTAKEPALGHAATPMRRAWLLCMLSLAAPLSACKSTSSSATDGGSDGATDVGPLACTAVASAGTDTAGTDAAGTSDSGAPVGVADDFGPNAKAGSTASALGQLDVYEVTTPRWLDWVDLYLRADLIGTRLTIAVYEAPARNAIFERLTTVQVDVPPCVGWVGTGPLGIPLEVGRFYAIGFDPNQAVTTFVDSESNDLPIDGQFGRLIGSETSTSVSLDTLDWGMPSNKSFTRQRIFTAPRDASDGGAGADVGTIDGAIDVPHDGGGALDANGPDASALDTRG